MATLGNGLVALKLLHEAKENEGGACADRLRAERELGLLKRLRHQNVVRVWFGSIVAAHHARTDVSSAAVSGLLQLSWQARASDGVLHRG